MGAAQTRCCGTCDKQQQLKVCAGDRQAYTAWDADGQDALAASHLASAEALPSLPPDARADCGRASWGHCCSDAPDGEVGVEGRGKAISQAADPASEAEVTTFQVEPTFAAELSDETKDRELVIDVMKRRLDDDLGIQVIHNSTGVLRVCEIHPGGAVEAANVANAQAGRKRLQVNDLILTVNGIGGDDEAMAEEFKRAERLSLGVRRGRTLRRLAADAPT